jgi:DNA repair exonuclease SbcCD ATPase subunit
METGSITESIVSQAVNPEVINNASESIEVESSAPQVDDWSQKLALLAKKERGLLEKQKSWQQKLKDMEEKEKKFSEWEQLDRLATENPSEFFKKKGLKFEELQDKMLASLTDEELDPIQKQLKELKTQLSSKDEEYKKLLEEKFAEQDSLKKNQEIEEQSKYYNEELKKHIANSGEKYELIQTFEAADEVFNVIKQVYLKTLERGAPKLMTFDDACELMEKKLEETLQGMSKSNKVKKLLGVNADDDFFGSKVMGQFTLDDSFSQSSANSPELKTEEERLRAAAKLFEQQLKSF